jgi:hypothetical protein
MAALKPIPPPSVAWIDSNGRPTQAFFEYLKSRERAGIANLSDVTISSVSNGQSLVYNSTTLKWENGAN